MSPQCDSVDGPVVTAARQALESGDVDAVLPYVPAAAEPEVRTAFDRAVRSRVRGAGDAEATDRRFFRDVVRVHRAGEGAASTGLRDAGVPQEPVVRLAQEAAVSGSVDDVHAYLSGVLRDELIRRTRHLEIVEDAAGWSVAAARQHVTALLDLQVYCHRTLTAITATAAPHAEGGPRFP